MDTEPQTVLFRASKKRKAYRQRAGNDDDETQSATPTAAESNSQPQIHEETKGATLSSLGDGGDESSVAAAIRARKARSRLAGVGFRSTPHNEENSERGLVPRIADGEDDEGQGSAMVGITHRFSHQTGLVPNLDDKHMNEYIEARIKSRKAQLGNENSLSETAMDLDAPGDDPQTKQGTSQLSTTRGRILEVPIDRNDLMRFNDPKTKGSSDAGEGNEPRLGPDGKPWRGKKNRRGSDDIARDRMVEDFLHENRLDVYDVPPPGTAEEDDSQNTDKKMADEFRRQYMNEMAQRRRQRRKPVKKPNQKPDEEVLRGPKLGGSRNLRSQVRNALLKEKADKK